jgi:hypothetical protein
MMNKHQRYLDYLRGNRSLYRLIKLPLIKQSGPSRFTEAKLIYKKWNLLALDDHQRMRQQWND